ncbi:hypothetical protein OUZ56_000251 [Daphnia magna]|uniref:Uncharacterized protein n=1 Tax=Daphnia magna TaxID=35525 RepID=A0ABQ9ZZ41_9CRUS|nr:hypothetical protein OUZ56_000251 [Daphnia magna]
MTGGIFREDQKDGSAELAFKYAVYRLNRERTILPNTTLVYDIQYVPRDDSFRTSKKDTAYEVRLSKRESGTRTQLLAKCGGNIEIQTPQLVDPT